jgi:hypothetical protein
MPIFISYSRQDKHFVDNLAMQLVAHKARVWLDRWELHVGDSLIKRIQEAIAGASALLVMLSKASVQSEWCQKELSAGLIRELEEKRVVVLPVLIEDCEIPLFLRDKLYADFRHDFDEGLQTILESIAKVTSSTLGRFNQAQSHIDWSVDWDMVEDFICLRFTSVEHTVEQPYSVLTEIRVLGDEVATSRVIEHAARGLREYSDYEILTILHNEIALKQGLHFTLDDAMPKIYRANISVHNPERIYDIKISSRRLGQDTGRDILLDIGGHAVIKQTLHEVNKPHSEQWDEDIGNMLGIGTYRDRE